MLLRILVAVLALAILILSLIPKPPPIMPGVSDKVKHALAYWMLSLLLVGSLRARTGFGLFLLSFCIGVFYGGMIEILQHLVGRRPEWLDLAVDAVGSFAGAGTGIVMLRLLTARLTRRHRASSTSPRAKSPRAK